MSDPQYFLARLDVFTALTCIIDVCGDEKADRIDREKQRGALRREYATCKRRRGKGLGGKSPFLRFIIPFLTLEIVANSYPRNWRRQHMR